MEWRELVVVAVVVFSFGLSRKKPKVLLKVRAEERPCREPKEKALNEAQA
jgi:hypothetical protein